MSKWLCAIFFVITVTRGYSQVLESEPEQVVTSIDGVVQEIIVRGNAKVESEAILTLLKTRKADPLKPEVISEDIRTLFELGYFSDVKFYQEEVPGGVKVIVEVAEKPAITSISYEGNVEVTEDTLKDKIETKLYTIVSEATISADVRMIEKQYAEKGYYLAKVTYSLEPKGPSDVGLIFHVDEGGKVHVGSVEILGNKYFSTTDIIENPPGLASKPLTRSRSFGSSSLYQEDYVKRDLEYLRYIYQDQGFAEVKVGKAIQALDSDRDYVRLTFNLEEGLQYNVGSIDVAGDLLFSKEELTKDMKLKVGELFRYSRFTADITTLTDKYGDLGYAYADVNPKTTFDREKREVHIIYEITKGEKVYFGKMTIIGNTKTRDNVIRREFDVADSERYSGTRLSSTKGEINRLGYFEEVQVIKERDEKQENLLNLNVKVKEKPTGQLQAALGYTPASATQGSPFTGQGRYDEKNQFGKGWNANLSLKWNGEENYSLDLGFADPRVNDSLWSTGVNGFFNHERKKQADDVSVSEKRVGGTVFVGRRIIEEVRARLAYRIQKITIDTGDTYTSPRFIDSGVASSVIFSLSRSKLDNNLDPTSGSDVSLSQTFTGGKVLRGDQQYMESALDAVYYFPIDFSDTFRTYWKFHGALSYIYPFGDKEVPFSERYRLGGSSDLRGWDYQQLGPTISLLRSPSGRRATIVNGGDKKMYYQAEYFIPLIPDAGIKSLVFADIGRVYNENESLSFKGLYRDVGFGFRWITPIAPFRFEWAYPIENGKLGDMQVIFYIGY